jgi:hypothetical protein
MPDSERPTAASMRESSELLRNIQLDIERTRQQLETSRDAIDECCRVLHRIQSVKPEDDRRS